MAKRFPVLYPMPVRKEQYRQYLQLAHDPIEINEYTNIAWAEITPKELKVCNKHKNEGFKKPLSECIKCNRYQKGMIEKTIANLVSCGFLEKKDNIIKLPLYSESCLNTELSDGFSQGVMSALEHGWGNSWGDQLAVEAVLDILAKLPKNSEDFMSQKDLRKNHLSMDIDPINGYDFNIASEGSARTLRELLKLLEYIGLVETDGDGKYRLAESNYVTNVKKRFRYISFLKIAEDAVDALGPTHPALTEDFIMTLSKYYIYRHTRGIGKQRLLIKKMKAKMDISHDKLIEEYYKKEKKNGQKGKTFANSAKNYKKILIKKITKKIEIDPEDPLIKNSLPRLSATSLIRITQSKTLKELKTSIRRSKGRFDRSILDEIRHSDGLFVLPNSFKFYSTWQNDAVKKWAINGEDHKAYSGIVSAVTGSGKTIMAMLAIQEYFKENPNSRVSIIVPTKVLMYQWCTELAKLLGLSSKEIGLRGDGFKDSFTEGKRILVSIINSAILDNNLQKDVESLSDDIKHLLIADECHRYGGEEFKRVFDCKIDARLGLSATPPADKVLSNSDEADNSEMVGTGHVVIESLGDVFFSLNYNRARNDNLICKFKVKYLALKLTDDERIDYNLLTKSISKALEKIRLRYGHIIDSMKADSLDQKLQVILKNEKNPDSAIGKYFTLTKERRDIIYNAEERKSCYNFLLWGGLKNRKIMVFHEKIIQLESVVTPIDRRWGDHGQKKVTPPETELEKLFEKGYYKPVMYHSKQDPKWNRWAMEWFRKDYANIMLSVKALVEGVDVPAADLGIVRVSSSSVRQRIQTIGRILRKDRDKEAEIFVLFVKDTVDTNIFRVINWKEELGQSAVEYHEWDEDNNKLIPRRIEELPKPREYVDNRPPLEVDVSDLKPGDKYPGRFAGDMYHVAADGKPYKRSRLGRIFLKNNAMIKAGNMIRNMKGGGKLLVTPQGNMVTNMKGQGTIFLGTVDSDSVREEVNKIITSFKSKKRKRISDKPPTFEELFGSTG